MAASLEPIATPEEKSQEISSENELTAFYQYEGNLLRIYLSMVEDADSGQNISKSLFGGSRTERSLFVLDYSGSMHKDWSQIQDAVRYFVDNCDSSTKDKTDFIVYNDASRLSNINEILNMQSSGMTSFDAAFTQIESYLNRLQTNNNNKNSANSSGTGTREVINVVFMTDGLDNCTRDLSKRMKQFESVINNNNMDGNNIIIHSIGFTSAHDRKFLENLCKLSNYSNGIYRFADKTKDTGDSSSNSTDNNNNGSSLADKFEEMFDFLAMSNSVQLSIDSNIKYTTDVTRNSAYGVNNGKNSSNVGTNGANSYEIDFIIDLSDDTYKSGSLSLLERLETQQPIELSFQNSNDNNNNNVIKCEFLARDELFEIKKIEMTEIKNETELESAQMRLNAIKTHKIRNKTNRMKAQFLVYLIQLKLNKYYQLFSNIKRGLIKNDDNSILAELNSLRYETTFSKARQQRAMNKRIIKNMNQFNEIQNELNSKIEFPPNEEIMNKLFKSNKKISELKCLLSNDTIFDVMTESNDNIMVFTLNVVRAEHLIDAPTAVLIKKYLIGYYSFEAIKNATKFAINENGTSQALGGFVQSSQFKYKYGMNNGSNSSNEMKNEEKEDKEEIGLFRGCDGVYPNAYLPLYLNSEHFKRVEIFLKPILGYFFTLDPLGFKPNQYLGLYYILGHMLVTQINNKNNDSNDNYYSGEWFEWLLSDFSELCKHLLPTLANYMKLEKDGILGNTIKSGNLLSEWMVNENIRFSKQIVQNLLLLVGLYHCEISLNGQNSKDSRSSIDSNEFEIKFVQELWRRNFGVYYKSVPKSQVDQILDSLLFDLNKNNNNENENDSKTEAKTDDIDAKQAGMLLEETKYIKYAKLRLGLSKDGDYYSVADQFKTVEELFKSDSESKDKSFDSYNDVLIDWDSLNDKQKSKINGIIDSELQKINNLNQFVNEFMHNKAVSGANIGLNGKLRWLMVVQAIRYHRFNAVSVGVDHDQSSGDSGGNSSETKERYLCAYDCLVRRRFSLEQCLGEYISYKDRKMKETSDAMLFDAKSLNIARYIVYNSKDILSFIGKLMHYVPTRGGKIFNHIIGLLFHDRDDNGDKIELYYDKLRIIMNGKYLDKYKVIANGTSWIHCPLSTVIKFKDIVGSEDWKIIEDSMHGTYGWVYRQSDKPNRHGHCNSNPNPDLVTVFRGFGV